MLFKILHSDNLALLVDMTDAYEHNNVCSKCVCLTDPTLVHHGKDFPDLCKKSKIDKRD